MDPQEAAQTAARSAAVLVTALEQPWPTGSDLGEAIAALAARMDPREAARTADRLVTVLEQLQPPDSSGLESLGEAVAPWRPGWTRRRRRRLPHAAQPCW